MIFPHRGGNCAVNCRILIWRQIFCDCVIAYPFFFLRRKKNSEKERPLRGFRREVRFIMSPPGKRRHNELNAAPPPETPPGNGQAGSYSRQRWGTQQRKFPYSGQNLFVRRTARHDPNFGFPSEGKLRPQAVMRCRFRLRNRFQTKK